MLRQTLRVLVHSSARLIKSNQKPSDIGLTPQQGLRPYTNVPDIMHVLCSIYVLEINRYSYKYTPTHGLEAPVTIFTRIFHNSKWVN